MKKFVIFADFQINRTAITDEFCENIETDDNCQGTCHLVKEIKKENPEKKKSPFTSNDQKNEVLFFESITDNSILKNGIRSIFSFVLTTDFNAHLQDVYHPPKLSFYS